jgi:hypothetical protein
MSEELEPEPTPTPELLSSKLVKYYGYPEGPVLLHWCAGCQELHALAVDQPFANGNQYTFNGNLSAPTFAPEMLIEWGTPDLSEVYGRCRYTITDGQITYSEDSLHDFNSNTAPLADIPAHKLEELGIVNE